jgi:16S rRNA (cytidine1402-2'-O)-methyltransferase
MGRGPARLVVIGTPIGNLGDLSPRAVDALAAADVVACEDTRRSGRLLAHAGVRAPQLVRVDDHTEDAQTPVLLERIRGGAVVALVSDAGMPGLSDPGARVVAAAAAAGIEVEVVPGPFAAATALVASGLLDASGRFCFEGFLPRKGAARRERLDELVGERRAVVLYEAPHRLARTLAELVAVLGGGRRVAVCRELTKLHEEVWRGDLAAALARAEGEEPRGEHVLVLDGAPPPTPAADDELRAALDAELAGGATRRDAGQAVAARFGVAPNRVKRLLTD